MAGNRTLKLSILADVDDLNKKLKSANGDVEESAGKLEKFGKVAGAAFAAAAVAAGAYAIKIGVEGVKAALEDEQSQLKLAQSLEKATGATKAQIAATETSIDKMARATGVADDQLRPALARLSLSTGDLSKAQDLLSLALDISAQTGKPLEGVANALGKAYDGNNAALSRLGVGLSAAELKTMTFTDVQSKLTDLFGGAAAENADTYAGRMARLQVVFDEAKEAIGARLLPIIENLVTLIVDKVAPNLEKFAELFKPITDAISRNKETFADFGKFIEQYVVPVLTVTLGAALKTVGFIAGGVIDVIASVIRVIQNLVSGAIDGINLLIKAYNAIPLLPNIPLITKPSISLGSTATSTTATKITTPNINLEATTTTASTASSSLSKVATTTSAAATSIGSFQAGSFRAAEAASSGDTYNINVSGALDKEAVARQIVTILNESSARGSGGASALQIA
jgi:hypothetical protein